MEKIQDGIRDLQALLQNKEDEIQHLHEVNNSLEASLEDLRSKMVQVGQELDQYKNEIKTLSQLKTKHHLPKKMFGWL